MEYMYIASYCFNTSYVNKYSLCFIACLHRFSGYEPIVTILRVRHFLLVYFTIPEIVIFFGGGYVLWAKILFLQ